MSLRGSIAGRRHHAAALAATLICSTMLAGPEPALADGTPSPPVAAPRLDWSACTTGSPFDCATAKVPLDYGNPAGRAIDLAVIRHKATDPGRRVGTLFFNPGGPGGPGTVQMPQNYDDFPQEVRERFDIVSWDPRGIGNSTAVNCFSSPEEAAAWAAGKPAGFPVGAQQRAAWDAAYKDLGQRCLRKDPELLELIRTGPPRLSLFGIPGADELGNTVEFFVHGEDVRRAQDGWAPRVLDAEFADVLWKRLAQSASMNGRRSPSGLVLRRPDGQTAVARKGAPVVTVTGEPGELLLFVMGRQDQAQVELEGEKEAVDKVQTAELGM